MKINQLPQPVVAYGLCLLLLSTGCGGGSNGPEMYSVSGQVSFEGSPVNDGRITFRRQSDGKAFSTPITEGEYELKTEEGMMDVAIIATREVPGKMGKPAGPDEEPTPVKEMYIPKNFNENTTLTANVSPDGENEFEFSLTGK